jgi:hypothetical protein
MGSPAAFGIGLATRDGRSGRLLDAWFPTLGRDGERAAVLDALVPGSGTRSVELDIVPGGDPDLARIMAAPAPPTCSGTPASPSRSSSTTSLPPGALSSRPRCASTCCRTDSPSRTDLARRDVRPAPNVAWTDHGPVEVDAVDAVRLELAGRGIPLRVTSIDRFPRMTDYVTPPACASPTRTGSGSARTSPLGRPSCTRGS